MNLATFVTAYSNDILISKLSLKELTKLSILSKSLQKVSLPLCKKIIGNLNIYTWARNHTLYITLWGDGLDHFVDYCNNINYCIETQKNNAGTDHRDKDCLYHPGYYASPAALKEIKKHKSINHEDNKYFLHTKRHECYYEDVDIHEIIIDYYIHLFDKFGYCSLFKHDILTGKLSGNRQIADFPEVIFKYY